MTRDLVPNAQTFQISQALHRAGNTYALHSVPNTPSIPTPAGPSLTTYSNKGGVWAWEEWGVSLGQQILG
ncbi:unnamed protein product [Rhizoctonia solani]|uniref:Uncharacterized protein n=1 Tax=Rhizoctonia solani TaxID=456999 RepID=A0A8H3ACJ8_9AGAM|nr:unnamed protein product [Rhizoctonia solani]